MNIEQVNRVMARECGVVRKQYAGGDWYFIYKGKEHNYLWTIEDARCREIIREKFGICTIPDKTDDREWWAGGEWQNGTGKTIKEAEIKCITEIAKGLEQ